MATKNYTCALLLLLAPMATAHAGPYIYAGANIFEDSIAAPPDVAAGHVVDRVERSEKGTAFGPAIGIGYRWSRLYLEAGYTGLGRFENEVAQIGTEADGTEHTTRSIREAEGDTVELKLGLILRISERFTFYAEAGAHRYTNTLTTSEKVSETDANGFTVASTTTVTGESEIRDTDSMYGAGMLFALPGADVLKVGVSHYAGIDRTGLSVLMHFGF